MQSSAAIHDSTGVSEPHQEVPTPPGEIYGHVLKDHKALSQRHRGGFGRQSWEEQGHTEGNAVTYRLRGPPTATSPVIFHKRYTHPNVQCSTVYSSQDMEAV